MVSAQALASYQVDQADDRSVRFPPAGLPLQLKVDALTSTLEGAASPLLTSKDTWIIRALPKLGNPQRPPPFLVARSPG
jgi:hypothetical protein